MRWMILIALILYGCGNANIIDEPVVDQPVLVIDEDTESVPVEEPKDETVDPVDNPPEEVEEPVQEEPVVTPTEEPVEEIDPHSDLKVLVDTYHSYIGEAVSGDEKSFEDAYSLISGYAKRTTGWASSLERFKQFAEVQLVKYENTGTVLDFQKSEKYGRGYRVYYDSSQGEINYYIEVEDGLFYISSCSKKGCIYWTT